MFGHLAIPPLLFDMLRIGLLGTGNYTLLSPLVVVVGFHGSLLDFVIEDRLFYVLSRIVGPEILQND